MDYALQCKAIQDLNFFAIDHCRSISHREHNLVRDSIHSAPVELHLYTCIYFRKAFEEHSDIQIAIDYEMKHKFILFLVIDWTCMNTYM